MAKEPTALEIERNVGNFAYPETHTHDAGVGLRWLIPQLNSTVIRIDWAFATQSTTLTRAGFPGRASAGFQQIF